MIRKIHEWLAEHTDMVQYPRPVARRIYPAPPARTGPSAPFARGLILLIVGSGAVIFGLIVTALAGWALWTMIFG